MKTLITLLLMTAAFTTNAANPAFTFKGKKAEKLFKKLDLEAKPQISISINRVVAKKTPGVSCSKSISLILDNPADRDFGGRVSFYCSVKENLSQRQLQRFYEVLDVRESLLPGRRFTSHYNKQVAGISFFKTVNHRADSTVYDLQYKNVPTPTQSFLPEVSGLKVTQFANLMPVVVRPGERVRTRAVHTVFDFEVISTGCTEAEHFSAKVTEKALGFEVSLEQNQLDNCEGYPHLIKVQVRTAELPVLKYARKKLQVTNPTYVESNVAH